MGQLEKIEQRLKRIENNIGTRFSKRGLLTRAIKFMGSNQSDIMVFMAEHSRGSGKKIFVSDHKITIDQQDFVIGEWIVKDSSGNFIKQSNEEFHDSYEEI